MPGKRASARRRVTVRNPLVPLVRALRAKVKPSAKAYSRKAKQKRRRRVEADEQG